MRIKPHSHNTFINEFCTGNPKSPNQNTLSIRQLSDWSHKWYSKSLMTVRPGASMTL